MKLLLYRGFYTEFLANGKPCQYQHNAINWRYQVAGNQVSPLPVPERIYKAPKAINWRWQY